MAADSDPSSKANCSIWTALEQFVTKTALAKLWELSDTIQPANNASKNKVKFKVRSVVSTLVNNCRASRKANGSPTTSIQSKAPVSCRSNSHLSDYRAVVERRDADYPRMLQVHDKELEILRLIEKTTIDCSLQLSRAGAQVERLMGSNVIRLTDRKYMAELRQRLRDDFNEMLLKRIRHREAEEMQRQRVLLMTDKQTICPDELKTNGILTVHESPNKLLMTRRAKLRTRRERMAERLVRKGKKWEADRLVYMEQERLREAENKIREIELLSTDHEQLASKRFAKRHSRAKPRPSNAGQEFWDSERALMMQRLKPSDKQFKPFTKDLRIVDAKRRMSEASITSLKSIVAKVTSSLAKSSFQLTADNSKSIDDGSADEKTESSSAQQPVYVNPMIKRLKETQTVHEMYALAAKIVGENIDKYMFDATSGEIDESPAI